MMRNSAKPSRQPISFVLLVLSSAGWGANNPNAFCTGSTISIIRDNELIGVSSNRLGHGHFTGITNVEFNFVGSMDGNDLNASNFVSSKSSASQDLVQGIEDLVRSTVRHEEDNIVSLAGDVRPRIEIITDIECPATLEYAEAGSACLHFVVEVPLAITNGPDAYIVKDVMKSRLLKATNIDGTLYDSVKIANDETPFVGIGKPGN